MINERQIETVTDIDHYGSHCDDAVTNSFVLKRPVTFWNAKQKSWHVGRESPTRGASRRGYGNRRPTNVPIPFVFQHPASQFARTFGFAHLLCRNSSVNQNAENSLMRVSFLTHWFCT